ncbi:MAG: T9SS type A sorting domain-containing protein, partial [Bacteroidota bacterium]
VTKWQSSVSPFTSWTDISNTALTYISGALSQTTQFRAVVQSGSCGITNSALTTVSVSPNSVGGSVSVGVSQLFLGQSTGSITLSGQTGNIVKWQKRLGTGAWIDIINTTQTYTEIPNIIGFWEYRAIVQSGSCGIATSSTIIIEVLPSNAGAVTGGATPICLGTSTGIMTLAGYTGTILKWQKRVNLGVWIDISNTTITYSEIPTGSGTWEYRAVINNVTDLFSAPTVIIVNPITIAGAVTGGTSICYGNTTEMLTLIGNVGSVLKWQSSVAPFTTWSDISNTETTYTSGILTQNTQFRAVVQSGSCAMSNSTSTTVSVSPTTVSGTVTGGTSICAGSTSDLLTLTGNVGTVIKWQSSVFPFTTWTDIINTEITYISGGLSQTTQFRAVVQSGSCTPTNSISATVNVFPTTVAGTVTGGTPTCSGSTSGLLNLAGNVGNVVKWQSSVTPYTTWTDITNTQTTYTSGILTQNTQFRAVVQSGSCAMANSSSTTVSVSPTTVAGTVIGGTSICSGSTSELLTLTGNVGTVIKWQSSVSPYTTWTDIANTALTYTSGVLTQTTQFRAVVQSGSCSPINSVSTTVTIFATTVAGTVTGGTTICTGNTSGLLTLSGNVGTILKWQSSVSPYTTWTDISNTATTYASGILTQNTQYRAVVQSGTCGILNSLPTTVEVDPVSIGGSISAPISQIFFGESIGTISLNGYSGNIIKWQKRLGVGVWVDAINTTAIYTETPSAIGLWEYRAVVQSGTCPITYSSSVFIEVLAANAGSITGGNSPICLGSSTGVLTLSGYSGTIIKWQKRLNSGTWIDIVNTASIYSETPLSSGTWDYRAVINNGTDQFSLSKTIVVSPTSVGGNINGSGSVCTGNDSGTLTLINQTGSVVKWQKSITPFSSWSDISNTATTYTSGALIQPTQFRAVVQSGSCNIEYSTPASIQVDPMPTALFDYNATNLNVTFINQSTNATSYSWLFGSASSTSTEINPTFLYPGAGQYTVILNAFNGQCSATSSLLITVTDVAINEQVDVLFSIFPVPTTGKITIQFGSKIMENAQLSVFDITGKMMVNKLITGINSNNSIELDLSELVAGVYRIRVEDNTNVINKAIVIER